MSKILIIHSGRHGQTRKIAVHLGRCFLARHFDVELYDARLGVDRHALETADAVILGSSVQLGRHMPEIRAFAKKEHALLQQKTNAFFSVSMAAAETSDQAYIEVSEHLDGFFKYTNWTPGQVAVFAGALRYTEYDLITRWVMKNIARRTGGPTDTSKDHEFTDWAAVDAFADAFIQRIRPRLMPLEEARKQPIQRA